MQDTRRLHPSNRCLVLHAKAAIPCPTGAHHQHRTTPLPPKVKDAVYTTPQYHAWRNAVVRRAGARCEYHDHHGHRCTKAQPEHRMFADHIVEIKDGGSILDVTNGQCLCYSHHTIKTNEVKKNRYQTIIK